MHSAFSPRQAGVFHGTPRTGRQLALGQSKVKSFLTTEDPPRRACSTKDAEGKTGERQQAIHGTPGPSAGNRDSKSNTTFLEPQRTQRTQKQVIHGTPGPSAGKRPQVTSNRKTALGF